MMKRKTIAIAAAVMAGCLGTAPAAYAEYDAATVEQVQQALNDAGFDCGTPDGIAGEMTAAAIRAYEEANGLPADGEIDEELISKLLYGEDELILIGIDEPSEPEAQEAADGELAAEAQEAAGTEIVAETETETEPAEELPVLGPFDETAYAGQWATISWDSIYNGSSWEPVDTAFQICLPEEWTQAVPADENCILRQYGSLFYVSEQDRAMIEGMKEYDTAEPAAPCLIVSVSAAGSRVIDPAEPDPVDLQTLDDYAEAYSRIKTDWTITKVRAGEMEALLCEIPESDITSLILLEDGRFYALNIRCSSQLDEGAAENILASVKGGQE